MVHCVFWRFSGGAPASQPASQPGRGGGEGGGFPKPPSHPAAARRNSNASSTIAVTLQYDPRVCFVVFVLAGLRPKKNSNLGVQSGGGG